MNIPAEEKTELDINRILNFLLQSAFFKALSDQIDPVVLYSLCKELQYEEFEKDEEIFCYGDDGDTFYIILQGKVGVMVPLVGDCPGIKDSEGLVLTETAVLKVGDAFGELALLRQQPRAATIVTKVPSVMLTLDAAAYNKILGAFD